MLYFSATSYWINSQKQQYWQKKVIDAWSKLPGDSATLMDKYHHHSSTNYVNVIKSDLLSGEVLGWISFLRCTEVSTFVAQLPHLHLQILVDWEPLSTGTKTVIKQKSYSVEVNWEAASGFQGSPDHHHHLIHLVSKICTKLQSDMPTTEQLHYSSQCYELCCCYVTANPMVKPSGFTQ